MKNLHIPLLRQARASWLYPIYIPSYGRAGSAPLLKRLSQSPRQVQRKVHLVIRPQELQHYQQAYPWITYIILEGTPGIGPARMACLQDADQRGYPHIVMLDDDIRKLQLLERISRENKPPYTRRYSSKQTGLTEPEHYLRALAVGCHLAGGAFRLEESLAYGATRNALFSGEEDTSIGFTYNKGSFPACVMFFEVQRFTLRELPSSYHAHGEDLAMFLDTLSQGQAAFTLPGVAYDQHSSIPTTIPLDPEDERARTPDLEAAQQEYPALYPYLRASVVNPKGGVKRIGVNWRRWYQATGTSPQSVPLSTLLPHL